MTQLTIITMAVMAHPTGMDSFKKSLVSHFVYPTAQEFQDCVRSVAQFMMMVVPVRKGNISDVGIPMVFRIPTVTTPAPISVKGPRFMPRGAKTASAMAITSVFFGTTGASRTFKIRGA